MKDINLADLIPMDLFIGKEPIKIDIVYAQEKHPRNIFETALYKKQARLWAHKDIAAITLSAARRLNQKYNYVLELQDCFRPIDAQEAMQETLIVKQHPEWMEEPDRLLAPPGAGGHPRAMAIDVRVLTPDNQEVDMGTPFDYMDIQSHRTYLDFPNQILQNRKMLEDAFVDSASDLGFAFLPLPSEWWDFRFPPDYTYQFAPLRDADLPPQMQMTANIKSNIPDFPQEHFDKLTQNILNIVDESF